MCRTRRLCSPLLVPLLLLSACDGGGEKVEIARPQDLRISIVQGKAMRSMVRDPAAPADDPNLTSEPVTVQVSVVREAGQPGREGSTGPALDVRLPPVEIHWRTLAPRWCQPWLPTTPIVRGDTVSNFYRRSTLTHDCHLVVEGVVDGRVFDTDTAVVTFTPGPIAGFFAHPSNGFVLPFKFSARLLAGAPNDAYGNVVTSSYRVTATLTRGAPDLMVIDDTLIYAARETTGAVTLHIASFSRPVELWAIPNLTLNRWRLAWECYDRTLPGGAHADSIHYRLDDGAASYGSFSTTGGLYVSFTGTLTTRAWNRGEPVRETVVPRTTRSGAQRPFAMDWGTGGTAAAVPTGFRGGTLCEAPTGAAWGRTSPVRLERL